jgi:hypothetical protein
MHRGTRLHLRSSDSNEFSVLAIKVDETEGNLRGNESEEELEKDATNDPSKWTSPSAMSLTGVRAKART